FTANPPPWDESPGSSRTVPRKPTRRVWESRRTPDLSTTAGRTPPAAHDAGTVARVPTVRQARTRVCPCRSRKGTTRDRPPTAGPPPPTHGLDRPASPRTPVAAARRRDSRRWTAGTARLRVGRVR